MRDWIAALADRVRAVPRRELVLLVAAMAAGVAIMAAYVIARRHHALLGDEVEYDLEGRFFTTGHWWWSTTPFGVAHASAWKAPLYPAWVGFWYAVLGDSPTRVEIVQALLAPATIGMTWLLARRMFSPGVAVLSAWVVAVFPLVWEFNALLYSESLATPAVLLLLVLVLGREPTRMRSLAVGLVLGVNLLIRPSSVLLLAGIAAAWIVASGLRRGVVMAAISLLAAIAVVAPWTIRNQVVTGGFVPISVQDSGTLAGTFNPTSANDPVYPYAWRFDTPEQRRIYDPAHRVDDAELRARLQRVARRYVSDHPLSVLEAFYWNGLTRFWDVRRPGHAMNEVAPQGRSRKVAAIGLAMYYVILVLAILGLWRCRRRPEILFPIIALAVAASVVFTAEAATRYRAPLEPLIVIMACSVFGSRLARAFPATADHRS
jgi:4-amino-4-deoxy-L-arabinose transferase-like glycosyltransferase